MPTLHRKPNLLGRLIFPDTLKILYYDVHEDINEREHGSIWQYLDRDGEQHIYYVYVPMSNGGSNWETAQLEQLPSQVQALIALIGN